MLEAASHPARTRPQPPAGARRRGARAALARRRDARARRSRRRRAPPLGGFSLGMTQRLGLAAALLGDPQILVARRARQRPRPRGHPLAARLPAPAGRRGPHACCSRATSSSEVAQTVDEVVGHQPRPADHPQPAGRAEQQRRPARAGPLAAVRAAGRGAGRARPRRRARRPRLARASSARRRRPSASSRSTTASSCTRSPPSPRTSRTSSSTSRPPPSWRSSRHDRPRPLASCSSSARCAAPPGRRPRLLAITLLVSGLALRRRRRAGHDARRASCARRSSRVGYAAVFFLAVLGAIAAPASTATARSPSASSPARPRPGAAGQARRPTRDRRRRTALVVDRRRRRASARPS